VVESGSGNGRITAAHCPKCKQPIVLQATVEAFNVPEKWHFWGTPGQRFKVCEGTAGGYEYTHFFVIIGKKRHHRMAWVRLAAEPPPVQSKLL
jgi:hypothetical protein